MTGFLPLIGLLAAFVLAHTAMSRPGIRDPLVARLGRGGYGALNGIVSTVGMVAVFWAYFTAPWLELWPQSPVLRAAPAILMPIACILAVAGATTPYAGLRGDRLPEGDNQAPGILSITRHPVPWALILWAVAHLIANGDLASFLFFGVFLLFALPAPALIDARRRRLCGDAAWQRFAAATATVPFAGPGPIDWKGIGVARVAGGVILYIAIVLAHGHIIGVDAIAL